MTKKECSKYRQWPYCVIIAFQLTKKHSYSHKTKCLTVTKLL